MTETSHVESGFGTGIYWSALDIDVFLAALEYPEKFPLIIKFKSANKKLREKKGA